jgi:hypothetical protein
MLEKGHKERKKEGCTLERAIRQAMVEGVVLETEVYFAPAKKESVEIYLRRSAILGLLYMSVSYCC